jgi:hypothetical protein
MGADKKNSFIFTGMTLLAVWAGGMILGCSKNAVESYRPELGQVMGYQQIRHAKLWFAGDAGNWELAAYELNELREGFEEAAKSRPSARNPIPRPELAGLLLRFVGAPLDNLEQAIQAKDRQSFVAAYDKLTVSCTACHAAAKHGFNVIKRPTSPPFSNQDFAPVK